MYIVHTSSSRVILETNASGSPSGKTGFTLGTTTVSVLTGPFGFVSIFSDLAERLPVRICFNKMSDGVTALEWAMEEFDALLSAGLCIFIREDVADVCCVVGNPPLCRRFDNIWELLLTLSPIVFTGATSSAPLQVTSLDFSNCNGFASLLFRLGFCAPCSAFRCFANLIFLLKKKTLFKNCNTKRIHSWQKILQQCTN